MDINQFLAYILPSTGIYMAVGINREGKFAHIGCESIAKLVSAIGRMENEGVATYHACAAYKKKPYFDHDRNRKVYRVKDNWLTARSFWIDIDCGESKARDGKGYATQKDAAVAMAGFCKKHKLPRPLLISSGYGVHAYFVTDTDISYDDWCAVSALLKQLLIKDGILADPSRTADFASILRPVGTLNRKDPANPKPVKPMLLDNGPVSFTHFRELIEQAAQEELGWMPPKPEFLNGVAMPAVPEETYPEYKCSADKCADCCKQVAQVRDTKGDASYEHWRGVIGILTHCENGLEYAHAWTERRAETGHSNVDVDTRFNTWDSGPTTCAFFESINPEGCVGCPYHGKVTTPLQLGREQPEQEAAPTAEPAKEPVTLPDGYAWQNDHLVRYVQDKDGLLKANAFCNIYFRFVKPITNEDGKYEYLVEWKHPATNRFSTFRVSGECIGSGGGTMFKEFANYGILPTNTKTAAMDMSSYIKDSVIHTMKKADEVTTVSYFGWQPDNSFVIGDRKYLPSGKVKKVLLSGSAKEESSKFPEPKGTVEAYADALNWVYNRDGMEPMQYAIASLWGSLLAPFCDVVYKGIPCALTGVASGKGKTTAAMAGLYAFGDAGVLTIASDKGATQNARTAMLGVLKNLPLLFDEMTNISPRDLSALAYCLSNGVDRVRLQASGGAVKFAQRDTWTSQCVMTANTHLTAQLIGSGNTEAEAMRLFEIRVDNYPIPQLNPIEVASHITELSRNCGVAGEAYIRYLVTHLEEVRARVQSYAEQQHFPEALFLDSKYRFYRYHMTCTLLAADIMTELGICKFDLAKLHAFAVKAVGSLIEDVRANAPKGYDLLNQFLMDMAEHTIETPVYLSSRNEYVCFAKDLPKFRPPLVVRRIIGTDKLSDPKYNNTVLVLVSELRKWLVEHRGFDADTLMIELKRIGIFLRAERVSIARGCFGIFSYQGQAWILDYNAMMNYGVGTKHEGESNE